MSDILDELWKSRHQKDVLFLSIIDGYILKESKNYTDSIFYMKGDKVLIQYYLKTTYTHISYELIWSFFESKFSLNDQEIRKLMIGMLETHLSLKGTRPLILPIYNAYRLETHLKLV